MKLQLFAAALCLSLLPGASFAQEQESDTGDTSALDREAGPLRDRIRPVSGHMFLKQGRLELSPAAAVTVRDAFFTKLIFGGSVAYHLLETVAIGVRGGVALPMVASSAQVCVLNSNNTRSCRAPTYAELDGIAPGQMTFLFGAEAQWAPLYGKFSVVAEQFLHFDIYGIGGLAAVSYRGTPAGGGAATSLIAPAFNAGAGMRVFLNRFLTVRAELRDLVYMESFPTGDSLRNQLVVELGMSVFFPMSFQEAL